MNKSSCISKIVHMSIIIGSLFFILGYTSIATAANGCGHGWHRNAWGRCVLNAPGLYARPAPYHPGCWRNQWGRLRCYRYGY